MLAWAEKRLEALAAENLCGFIFKSRSPSSGMAAVKVYAETGMAVKKGVGIFAGAFMKRFPLLPVEEDGRLNDPLLRENFIERIFVYRRWLELEGRGRRVGAEIGQPDVDRMRYNMLDILDHFSYPDPA
jgi:hypothetical protein